MFPDRSERESGFDAAFTSAFLALRAFKSPFSRVCASRRTLKPLLIFPVKGARQKAVAVPF